HPVEGVQIVNFVLSEDESGDVQKAIWQLILPENLPEGWQLRLNAESVLDIYGRPLDGDNSGEPGGDWILEQAECSPQDSRTHRSH
nr:hypothetical protein [Kiritimatiellia bacterium]